MPVNKQKIIPKKKKKERKERKKHFGSYGSSSVICVAQLP